jgi:hypothetical protein
MATNRCAFCGRRLVWDYPTQEWVHKATGDVQGPDGHYAEAKTRRFAVSRAIIWVGLGLLVVFLLFAIYDALFCPGGPFFSENLC